MGCKKMRQITAIQKRLSLLLTRQIQKLDLYACLLEKEYTAINGMDVEKLTSQQQAEKLLIDELVALEKVIVPLEKMYQKFGTTLESDVSLLKLKFLRLRENVLARNARNRQLAEIKLADLKEERLQLRKNKLHTFAAYNSPYCQPANPALVDIMH